MAAMEDVHEKHSVGHRCGGRAVCGCAGVRAGFGVGPRYDRAYRDYNYDYAYGCPLVRERIVTPRGEVIYRTRRSCD